jgi:hypothetical protein
MILRLMIAVQPLASARIVALVLNLVFETQNFSNSLIELSELIGKDELSVD